MSDPTKSTRVLLIAPLFFGYEQDIAAELTRSGHQVDLLSDRPFTSPIMKAIMRFSPQLGGYRAYDRYFLQRMEEFGRTDYATILVVQGEGVTASTLSEMRRSYPRARIVFYTWDSINNKPNAKRNLKYYDRCFTFDPVDAYCYGNFFRPLFYAEGFDQPTEISDIYDLSFIGTVHSDRYRIIRLLLEQLPAESRTFIYLYLQSTWMYGFRRLFTNTIDAAKREEFRFEPLRKDLVQTIFLRSHAVIDIEHHKQRGATMRTIEALGSRRKLVTTNKSLRDYDFFNSNNIQIIDRKKPFINRDFLSTPYEIVPDEVRRRYCLSRWVFEVCGEGN